LVPPETTTPTIFIYHYHAITTPSDEGARLLASYRACRSYRVPCAVCADTRQLVSYDALIQRSIIRCLTLGWCRCRGRHDSLRLSRYKCADPSRQAGYLCDMGGAMRAGWYGWYAGVPFFRSLRPCVSCVFLFAACLHLSLPLALFSPMLHGDSPKSQSSGTSSGIE
jgi:hypothetical protein